MKTIKLEEAIKTVFEGTTTAYVLVPITSATSLEDLRRAESYVLLEEMAEEKTVKKVNKAWNKSIKPGGSSIDHGKIMALHRAGWPASKIAEEMKCSPQTVLNHINRERDTVTEPEA